MILFTVTYSYSYSSKPVVESHSYTTVRWIEIILNINWSPFFWITKFLKNIWMDGLFLMLLNLVANFVYEYQYDVVKKNWRKPYFWNWMENRESVSMNAFNLKINISYYSNFNQTLIEPYPFMICLLQNFALLRVSYIQFLRFSDYVWQVFDRVSSMYHSTMHN